MTKRIFSVAAALAMVVGLLAGVMGSASAAPATNVSWIFFPSVPNGQSIEGTGLWYGSVTIQNTASNKVDISFATMAGGTPLSAPAATLAANAAKTFSAAQLFANLPANTTNSGFAVEAAWDSSAGPQTAAPVISGVEKQAAPATSGFGVATSSSNFTVDGYTAIQAPDVSWGTSSKVCDTDITTNCNDLGGSIAGISLADFTAAGFASDGTTYLPIVQANWSGWNTMLNITNIDASTPATAPNTNPTNNVTVKFFQAGTGTQIGNTWTGAVAAGQTQQLDVGSVVGTTPFVGSAEITSPYAMVTNAVRVKSSTNMAIINTGAPSLLTTSKSPTTLTSGIPVMYPEQTGVFSLNAPLVFRNYDGWNTGINIVNISPTKNTVVVTFFDASGQSVSASPVTIPAMGMDYVYIPALASSGTSDFGQATISGSGPLYAAVDEVKYSTGDAMSYMATGSTLPTANGITNGNSLALPLFQNGQIANNVEQGDASGINLQNPGNTSANVTVSFYNLDGTSSTGVSQVTYTIPANGGNYVYAPSMANLPTNVQLTAIVTANSGRVSAVSNNVNYDVSGDGGSVFNLSSPYGQYRFSCSASECGIQAVTVAAPGT